MGQGRRRGYVVNECFFETIDTEAKAYVLGFASADGCVSGTSFAVSVALGDRDHLDTIRAAMGSTHPVKVQDYWRHDSLPNAPARTRRVRLARFGFKSRTVALHLARLGVVERKSLVLRPAPVRDDLRRHYFRGLVDGDGWISTRGQASARRRQPWEVGLVSGGPWIVEAFAEFVAGHVATRATVKRSKTVYRIQYGGIALPQSVCRLLYEGSTIHLERKKALADGLLALAVVRRNLEGRTITLDGVTRRVHEWADLLGIKPATIYARMDEGLAGADALFAGNRRSLLITHNGETLTSSEWSRRLGIGRTTIEQRLHKGWPVENVLAPIQR